MIIKLTIQERYIGISKNKREKEPTMTSDQMNDQIYTEHLKLAVDAIY